jgi:F0F1-type ATP synthase delta subunit
MMTLSRRKVAQYAASQLADGVKNRQVAKYLAAYLYEQKSTRQIDLLIADIEKFLDSDHGHSTVHITSTFELTSDLKKQIVRQLGVGSKNPEVTESIDIDQLGGVIVRSSGREYDGSLRTGIKQLKTLGN